MSGWDIDVEAARRRVRGRVRKTPTFEVSIDGKDVVLKLEQLQVGGSFKYRGATNAIAMLPEGSTRVVAPSGGNHGLAVALAANDAGLDATIVVPGLAPQSKVDMIREAGATVVVHGSFYAEAQQHAQKLASQSNAHLLHPFADPNVIAGQGTLGLELLDQVGGICDSVVVAVGGGGLIAGVAAALAGAQMSVFGVEPAGAATLHAALRAGFPVDVPVDSIAASSLGAKKVSTINLVVAQRNVKDVALVDDDAIAQAQSVLWRTCRIAVEPGGATALAGVLSGAIKAEKPCVVLCGANSGWIKE